MCPPISLNTPSFKNFCLKGAGTVCIVSSCACLVIGLLALLYTIYPNQFSFVAKLIDSSSHLQSQAIAVLIISGMGIGGALYLFLFVIPRFKKQNSVPNQNLPTNTDNSKPLDSKPIQSIKESFSIIEAISKQLKPKEFSYISVKEGCLFIIKEESNVIKKELLAIETPVIETQTLDNAQITERIALATEIAMAIIIKVGQLMEKGLSQRNFD